MTFSRFASLLLFSLVIGCGSSGGSPSDPGPLIDNTKWVPSNDGEEFFGPRPEDAVCELVPIDCPQFPWPEGECVTLEPGCIVSFVPECFGVFTVLAAYTRMPNPAEPLCNWLTLAQPSLRDIKAGDEVEIRMYHENLTAPVPNGEARMMFVIGDELAAEYNVLIPSDSEFPTAEWTASKDYPAGTQLLFHVDNHGSNEYVLIEVNILDPAQSQ